MLAGPSIFLLPFAKDVDRKWGELMQAGEYIRTLRWHSSAWVKGQAKALQIRQSELESKARDFRVAFDRTDVTGVTSQLLRDSANIVLRIKSHIKDVENLRSRAQSGQYPVTTRTTPSVSLPSAKNLMQTVTGYYRQYPWMFQMAGVALAFIILTRR